MGANGEVIVPIINKNGEVEIAQRDELFGVKLTHHYQVITYRSRVEKALVVLSFGHYMRRMPCKYPYSVLGDVECKW